jgi:hypothetical protein
LLVETDIGEQSKELYNSITTKLSKAWSWLNNFNI